MQKVFMFGLLGLFVISPFEAHADESPCHRYFEKANSSPRYNPKPQEYFCRIKKDILAKVACLPGWVLKGNGDPDYSCVIRKEALPAKPSIPQMCAAPYVQIIENSGGLGEAARSALSLLQGLSTSNDVWKDAPSLKSIISQIENLKEVVISCRLLKEKEKICPRGATSLVSLSDGTVAHSCVGGK